MDTRKDIGQKDRSTGRKTGISKAGNKKPFVQVDRSDDRLSNFLDNFIRQFRNPIGGGLRELLGKLFGRTPPRTGRTSPTRYHRPGQSHFGLLDGKRPDSGESQ